MTQSPLTPQGVLQMNRMDALKDWLKQQSWGDTATISILLAVAIDLSTEEVKHNAPKEVKEAIPPVIFDAIASVKAKNTLVSVMDDCLNSCVAIWAHKALMEKTS